MPGCLISKISKPPNFAIHQTYNCQMKILPQIHVLGAGSIGCLIAQSIASLPIQPSIPQVILYLSSIRRLQSYIENDNSTVTIERSLLETPTSSQTFNQVFESNIRAYSAPRKFVTGVNMPIDNLIITTKAHQTLHALKPYLPGITNKTTVLLVQNGMGTIDQLCKTVWPDKEKRPILLHGITTHGIYRINDGFRFHHVGLGDLKIAKIPNNYEPIDTLISENEIINDETTKTQTKKLIKENRSQLDYNYSEEIETKDLNELEKNPMISLLIDCEHLSTSLYNYSTLEVLQWEKLIINACINPITALYDCLNGEILRLEDHKHIFTSIINECLKVIFISNPHLNKNAFAIQSLTTERLLDIVYHIISITKYNSSSMREDITDLRGTEIDYINGHIAFLGRRHGIYVPINTMFTNLIKARLSLTRFRADSAIKSMIS